MKKRHISESVVMCWLIMKSNRVWHHGVSHLWRFCRRCGSSGDGPPRACWPCGGRGRLSPWSADRKHHSWKDARRCVSGCVYLDWLVSQRWCITEWLTWRQNGLHAVWFLVLVSALLTCQSKQQVSVSTDPTPEHVHDEWLQYLQTPLTNCTILRVVSWGWT